jgi:hypothetical protein
MTNISPQTDSPATPAVTPRAPASSHIFRHDGWSPQRQRAFCEALAECGNVERAAQSVGMSRESAYRLRQRAAGRAFSLAWDAALLQARHRLIDDAFDMAFEGSIERTYRDGKIILEKRRRDPRALLATVERLGSRAALGNEPTKAVAQDFEVFLDCMESDALHRRGEAANFMERCADRTNFEKRALQTVSMQLAQAMERPVPVLESDNPVQDTGESV